ncbi:DUF2591 family protein [Chimaeribacter arupi]|uniref:phage protein NinX family protein n=1 Tax=Chimaeribacter arupi TaxID=2060066 RepID=UPI002711EDCA|nr:phage protein NinX family protein [Chimaeribacter arupi]WKZ94084.1 DUF2591 family protein [Chimaeribacter arupi]
MNYSEMSNHNINRLVANEVAKDGLLHEQEGKIYIHEYAEPVGEFGGLCIGWKEFDPCNSWADAGPIIQEHGIVVACYQRMEPQAWPAMEGTISSSHSRNKNPLRAAMECFLKMKRVGHAKAA